MKIIIAGGRDFTDNHRVEVVMFPYDLDYLEIVCGGAKGADALGKQFAEEHEVPITMFPADWDQYGKGAGHIRNREMADYGDILIAFWDGESRGTDNMIQTAMKQGLEVHVYHYQKEN